MPYSWACFFTTKYGVTVAVSVLTPMQVAFTLSPVKSVTVDIASESVVVDTVTELVIAVQTASAFELL